MVFSGFPVIAVSWPCSALGSLPGAELGVHRAEIGKGKEPRRTSDNCVSVLKSLHLGERESEYQRGTEAGRAAVTWSQCH